MTDHKPITFSKTMNNCSTNKKSIRHTRMHTMKTTWLLRMPLQKRRKMRLLCRSTINKTRIPLMLATSLNHSSWNAKHVINSFSLTTSYTSIFNLTATIIWWRLHWIPVKPQTNQWWRLCQLLCSKLWCCWICLSMSNPSPWIDSIWMGTDFKAGITPLWKQGCHQQPWISQFVSILDASWHSSTEHFLWNRHLIQRLTVCFHLYQYKN